MNRELFVQLKAGDFGLVVGRALAVYLWFVAAATLFAVALMITFYRDRYYSAGSTYLLTTGLLPALFHGVVGWGVWHGSARFAGSEGRASTDEVVQVSGKLLFCGLLMGVATYPVVSGGLSVVTWLLGEGATGKFPFAAIVHLVLGSGLFSWAYVAASRLKIPELEYVTGPTEATEATEGDGSD